MVLLTIQATSLLSMQDAEQQRLIPMTNEEYQRRANFFAGDETDFYVQNARDHWLQQIEQQNKEHQEFSTRAKDLDRLYQNYCETTASVAKKIEELNEEIEAILAAPTHTQLTSTQAELASTQTQLASTQRRLKWAIVAMVRAFAANGPQARETANNLWKQW